MKLNLYKKKKMKGTMKSEEVIVSPMEVVGTPPKIRIKMVFNL